MIMKISSISLNTKFQPKIIFLLCITPLRCGKKYIILEKIPYLSYYVIPAYGTREQTANISGQDGLFLLRMVYQSAQADIAKDHWLVGLNNRNLFCHNSGDSNLRSRCQQDWFLLRSFSLVYAWPAFLWIFIWTCLCAYLCPIFFSYKTSSYWIQVHPNDLILT